MVARNIRGVVEDYCRRMQVGDTSVSYGFVLDDDERRRRFAIQALLFDGLDLGEFRAAFGLDALVCFAEQWEALEEEGCVAVASGAGRLTARGVRHADVVGQLFFSRRVQRLADTFEYDT
jgi:oxygen-independent coproporphyrinogen-3 oxidase